MAEEAERSATKGKGLPLLVGSALAGGGIAVIAIAIWYGLARPPQPAPQTRLPVMAAAPQPATAPQATAPAPPRFDTVRHDPEGATLVAGTAAPGTEVTVLVDGQEVARVTTGAQGDFVAFVDLPPAQGPQVLTLMQAGPGEALESEQSIILAPRPPAPLEAPADPAPPVLLADDSGVRRLATEPAENVVIDTITYGEAGEVRLEGRATTQGHVRLYLDNAEAITVPVQPDGGWSTVLEDVEGGRYTLRVDELDAEGQVVSRFETPFQREDAELLAQAAPDTPEEGVAVRAVTVQPGFTLWSIAQARYGEGTHYVRVYEANRDLIRNPDLIYPGQVFSMPE